MSWLKLKKLDKESADIEAKAMGWKDDDDFARETGGSMVGDWNPIADDSLEDAVVDKVPENASVANIGPILCVVHGRHFQDWLPGLTDGQYAYVNYQSYEDLF